jgi:hypothetical protein
LFFKFFQIIPNFYLSIRLNCQPLFPGRLLTALFASLKESVAGDQVIRLLASMKTGDARAFELIKRMKHSHRPSLRKNYLKPAIAGGWIEMTQPEPPRNPTQRYRMTDKGRVILENFCQKNK